MLIYTCLSCLQKRNHYKLCRDSLLSQCVTWFNAPYTDSLLANLKGSNHSEDLGVDGRIIFEWALGKYYGKLWTRCIWLRIGTNGRTL
jgi:hypothetical protein